MAPLSVPLLNSNLETDARGYGSCCSTSGIPGVRFRRIQEDTSPLHFSTSDRRRHHHQALFFIDSEIDDSSSSIGVEVGEVVTPKPLSLWGMVAIIFFAVSGGPFGSEEAIATVGPFWVLFGFIVFPIIWSIPEALMTAELSTMFPGNGGYVFWTTASFGPRIGFLQGALSWLSNVTSIAVYPHLLLEYLFAEFPNLSVINSTIFLTFFTLCMSYVNYRGLHIIGSGGAVAIVLVLAPFGLMAILGFDQIDWSQLLVRVPVSKISALDFISFLNIMFWNLNSWENCSVLSGEIDRPQEKLPKAIGIALIITVFAYLVPLVVGIGVMGSSCEYSDWSAGFFQAVGYQIGGRWMSSLILVAAACGCIGQYQSILCSSSYSLESLGEMGMLPAVIAGRSKYDTPTVGIGIATVIILSLTNLGFVDIVQLLNSVYCLSLLVEFATLINLRLKCPDMQRPFKIWLNTIGLIIMVLPAVLTVTATLLVPPMYGQWMTTYYMAGGSMGALLLYETVELGRRRSWFEFCDNPPKDVLEVISRLKVF